MAEGCCSDERPPCGWLGWADGPGTLTKKGDNGPTNLPSADFRNNVVVNQTAEW